MDEETFALLLHFREKITVGFKDYEVVTKESSDSEVIRRRRFGVLDKMGMISYDGLKRFTITEYGHEVSNFESWQDYLDFQSKLKERELNEQKFDFQISRFQAKSKYLPYILSLLSLIVAVLAYIKSLDRQDSTQSMPDSTERTKDSISISTPTRTTDSTHISKTPVDSLKKD